MYVLMGTTRGDELVRRETHALAGGENKEAVYEQLGLRVAMRDNTLGKLKEAMWPEWGKVEMYAEFRVVEVPSMEVEREGVSSLNEHGSASEKPIYQAVDEFWRAATEAVLDQVKRAVARRCMKIARNMAASYAKSQGFPSHHAVGAEAVSVAIQREFGLERE